MENNNDKTGLDKFSNGQLNSVEPVLIDDVARQEVDKWLKFKRVFQSKREKSRDQIEMLIEGFKDGNLLLRPDFVLVQKLQFPVKNEDGKEVLKELEFRPCLYAWELQEAQKGMDIKDIGAFNQKMIGTVSTQPVGLIRKMMDVDYGLSQIITVFY